MRVEIWSDVVCPWCYVGTRRFEQALERLARDGGPGGADDIEVVHRAFERNGAASLASRFWTSSAWLWGLCEPWDACEPPP